MSKVTWNDPTPRELPVISHEEMQKINRYKKFAQEYMRTANSTEAAFRTYNCKDRTVAKAMGHKLRKKPVVQAYMIQAAEETGLTPEYVTGGIRNLAENAKSENTRLRAYELLGKMMTMFDSKTPNVNFNIDINDDEISKILGTNTKASPGKPAIVHDVDVS
jgi:hypothetical protein